MPSPQTGPVVLEPPELLVEDVEGPEPRDSASVLELLVEVVAVDVVDVADIPLVLDASDVEPVPSVPVGGTQTASWHTSPCSH